MSNKKGGQFEGFWYDPSIGKVRPRHGQTIGVPPIIAPRTLPEQPANFITARVQKNKDIQILKQFFRTQKTPKDIETIQEKAYKALGIIPDSDKLAYGSSFYNFVSRLMFGPGQTQNDKILQQLFQDENNVMQTYMVLDSIPLKFYNHPLATLTRVQPIGPEFYMYYEMLLITCALDKLRDSYENLLKNIADFEHRDALKRLKDGEGLRLDSKWINDLKIKVALQVTSAVGNAGNAESETEWKKSKTGLMLILAAAGFVSSAALASWASGVSMWSFWSFAGITYTEGQTVLSALGGAAINVPESYRFWGFDITSMATAFTALITSIPDWMKTVITTRAAFDATQTALQTTEAITYTSTVIEQYSKTSKAFREQVKKRKEKMYYRILKLITKMDILSSVLTRYN